MFLRTTIALLLLAPYGVSEDHVIANQATAGESLADAPSKPLPIEERPLAVPVEGVRMEDVLDTFGDARSGKRSHQATDILAPKGTPVLAVEDATVARLVKNKLGGITIYLVDPSETYFYYYAHLNGYAKDLTVGEQVSQGEVIGYVGTTGNAPADTPHLHFEINQMDNEKHVWGGTPINPYPMLVHSSE